MDKLGIYNLALGHLKERKLATLTENREPRRVLDDFYDSVIKGCIERAYWKFMIRATEIAASTTVQPAFGWLYAFPIPNDRRATLFISSVETFQPPLLDVQEETGFWFSNTNPIFVKYISDDPLYGSDISKWSQLFIDYVAVSLAKRACKRITNDMKLDEALRRDEKDARIAAKAKDAMNDPPRFSPAGTWVTSRRSGFNPPADSNPSSIP